MIGKRRQINPSICSDHRTAWLRPETRLLLRDLPMFCDVEGRVEFDPLKLAALVFPFDCRQIAFELLVHELEREGFLVVYEADDRSYLQMKDWDSSSLTAEEPSVLPPPPTDASPKN